MINTTDGPTKFEDLEPFRPLEVKVRSGNHPDEINRNFDDAVKRFKSLIQKSQILSLYKEKQSYEKPSDKKRRKRREAEERKRVNALREKQIASGEWDKKQKRKEKKRMLRKEQQSNQSNKRYEKNYWE